MGEAAVSAVDRAVSVTRAIRPSAVAAWTISLPVALFTLVLMIPLAWAETRATAAEQLQPQVAVAPAALEKAWAVAKSARAVSPLRVKAVADRWLCASADACYRGEIDLDGDGDTDVADIMLVAGKWRCRVGNGCYDHSRDLDSDGDIDIVDIMLVAALWGERC